MAISIGIVVQGIFPSQAKADVLNDIKKTGVIKVAIREDAAPFGYLDSDNNLDGYCLDLIALLRDKVEAELGRDFLSIRLLKSTALNRFELVEEGFVDLECGPNTIRNDLKNVSFSQPFLNTGIQFLIRQEDRQKIESSARLSGLNIGTIANTTTEKFVRDNYAQAQIKLFQGITGRTRGIQALQLRKIDAFASDGILLKAGADLLGLSSEEYVLFPDRPLTCDRYGVILPKNDRQWQSLVDALIQSKSVLNLADRWFGGEKDRVDRNFCQ